MKILTAVDGSFHANITARYSFVLAKIFKAKLFVATVLNKNISEKGEHDAEKNLEKILHEGREQGLNIEGIIMSGDVVGSINEFVKNNAIDMVISSTRRPHKENRFIVKSITSRLMSKLQCSVIGLKITHPGRSINPGKILIPVIGDGYMDKERADIAEAFAKVYDSMITVFHVVEIKDSLTKKLDRRELELITVSAERHVSSFIEELRKRGVTVTEKIVTGKTAREEIISEASHHKYDLIIAGATTRNIIKRIVSGNPVEEILRDTPCDVMLVHFR